MVGPNGAGKSTLLKIILGLVDPDAGEMIRSRSHTAGYLPQDGIAHAGKTLSDETATAFDDLLAMHARAEEIAVEIDALVAAGKGESPEVLDLVDEMGKLQHHLEHREGWSIGAKVEEVLFGLGFKAKDMQRETSEFSGGWQMRIALAKLLLREPTILMLDEPTNHLDIESLTWLEEYLKGYDGSVVVISHDRRFLDNLTRRTIEIANGKAAEYKGNYSYYLKEREIRLEMLRSSYENQQEAIRATMAFVDRFRYQATKARQVQSRLKQLDKIERIEMDDEQGSISFDFPPPPSPGRILMKLEGVTKAYGPEPVFTDLDLTLERGDRIAFLGSNGAGKSTLARIISGLEPIQAGTRTPGHNVIVSYYAQHQADELDPKKTVLETLEDAAPAGLQQGLRRLLGCFLFTGDDVFKRVAVLSGGEKSRLALAKMLLVPANLLILDEPTNHLDVKSKAVLQEALRRFAGAYCIVSHDRDFLEPLAAKVAQFRDGRVSLFLGGVSDWLEKQRREREAAAAAAKKSAKAPATQNPAPKQPAVAKSGPAAAAGPGGKPGSRPGEGATRSATQPHEKDRKRKEAERRQMRTKRLRPLQAAREKLEKKIAEQEGRKKQIESSLGDPAVCQSPEKVSALSVEYRELTTNLAYSYDDWAKLEGEIEKADRETAG
ncbi:MAG: ABC-F family ATP-binding cassette domain-containing protein [Candidatus Methylomirabilia bacterium]